MADYAKLNSMLGRMTSDSSEKIFADQVIPYLVGVWFDDYARNASWNEIVETTTSDLSYLFDVTSERLIAAWGISRSRHGDPRDKSRMAGHPLSAGPQHHRGHAIPHSLGGPTDLNLIPQLAAVNIGAFRMLENEAVRTPGALYFSHWMYKGPTDQSPNAVEQGLLCPGRPPSIRRHGN